MQIDSQDQTQSGSMSSLIAWMSLCLLSAAWGPLIPMTLRTVWGYWGLFGLAAGVALGALERRRLLQREREWVFLRRSAEERLDKFVPHVRG